MTITGVIEIVHRWDDPSLWRPNLGPFECNVTANVTSANALFLM